MVKNIKSCIICDYHTCNITDYNKHLETKKHKLKNIMIQSGENLEKNEFICKCGKKYAHLCSLSKHRHNCQTYKEFIEKVENGSFIVEQNFNIENKIEIINIGDNSDNKESISLINEKIDNNIKITETQILKNEINNEILLQLFKQQNELKMMVEKMANSSNYQNITNNTVITNNNNFNLHIFLNEKCKNAMSIGQFINSLKIDTNNVEYTGIHGYVEGITKIFIDGLNQLDIYERPIHCTDLKRETLYIKENEQWEKDNESNSKLKSAINTVVKKNMQEVKNWKDKNPKYDIMETKEYELHIHIMQQSLGGGNQEITDRNNLKIIKNISRHVYLDKKKV